jgi:hypothetical protein
MKTRLLLALCLVSLATGTASAGPRDARDHIQDAIDEAEESSGACRRAVLGELVEIKRLLRDDREARAAIKIQRLRQVAGSCPRTVDASLRRASDVLADARDDVRDRVRERQDQPPPRATDIPWSDFRPECLDQWVMVEVARGRLPQAQLDLFGRTFAAACTSDAGLGTSALYYPNGTTARSGSAWYYPNGRTALSGSTIYYPNGTTARSGNTYYFPNGTTAWTQTGWYYPNGNFAGTFELVTNWARGRANTTVLGAYDHAMQSDVEVWRMFHTIRLLAGR